MTKFIQDGQDPKIVEKIYKKIIDMLTHGEAINYIAIQKKPAVTLFPDSITISNKRIFLCEFTKLGLATNFEIFSWTDIKDIAFKEEIFGSKVTVIPFTGENLSIDYIPKVQARKLYQLIKDALENGKDVVSSTKAEGKVPSINDMYRQRTTDKEDFSSPTEANDDNTSAVEEKLSPIEDVTAVDVGAPAPFVEKEETPVVDPPRVEEDDELTLKLKRLKGLYDKQLITRAEYESKKSELLSQL